MTFDPEIFGQAMGEAIRKAVEPLAAKIADLEARLKTTPTVISGLDGKNGRDGKDCDMGAVKEMIEQAVKSIPLPANGNDGAPGKDGAPGEKGADGAGIADLLTDRDGALVATFTDGRMKNLGVIIGKDGQDGLDGKDGSDGVGLDSFEMEYLEESHEIRIKAACAGRVKEVRYPAGGIQGKGYWRDGTKAAPNEAWTHDGCLWIAKAITTAKPEASSPDWFLAARKGRDGERGAKGQDGSPPTPIKLKG